MYSILFVLMNLGAALAGVIVAHILFISLRTHLAAREFRRKSPKIPWLDGGNLLSGHANEVLYSSRNWMQIKENHRKYGKTVGGLYRNKPIVSTLDLNLIKTFIVDEPNEHLNRFNPHWPIDELCVDGILFVDVDHWRRLRKAVAPAFSVHKCKSPNVQAEINYCLDSLLKSFNSKIEVAKKAGSDYAEIELEDIFHRYTLDLLFTCFFKQPDLVDYSTEKDYWAEATDTFSRGVISPMFRFCIMFPILNPIISWYLFNFHPTGELRSGWYKLITKHIETNEKVRKELESKGGKESFAKVEQFTMSDGSKFKRTLVDYVLDNYFEGKITRREYIHSVFTLMMGAHKSSVDALTKLFYNLAKDQRVQTKLRHLAQTEGEECEYLGWVMHESMRMFPPLYVGASRTISRDMETDVGVIPAGTFIYTPNFLIHKLKEYWGEDAEEFKPERWANAKNFNPVQYLAFGAGKRNCVGMNFALVEIRMLLYQMILRFRFDESPKTDPRLLHEAPALIFTTPDTPTYIRISPV